MALEFAHGAIQWNSADVATTVYTASGLGFQPKALRFYWMGLGSAVDADSETVHSRRGVGFATSTSDRRCVATQDQDAAGTSICTTGYRTDAVATTLTSTPIADGLLDLNSITANGFTLIVDDASPVNITVFWEAWGGEDIIAAATGEIAEPAAIGAVDYVVTGAFKPDVVMFAGVQATGVAPTAARGDSGFCVGFATGPDAENVVVVGNSDDASAAMDTDGYCQTGECLAQIIIAGGNPSARAAVTQFNADGFQLNWIARATTNRRNIYLAISGGAWRAGAYTIAGNILNATALVGGLPMTPRGVLFMGRMTVQSTAGIATVNDLISLGSALSPSSRQSQGSRSENNTGSSLAEIDLTIQYDQILSFPNVAGAVGAATDLRSIGPNAFEVIVDVATTGVASEWQGYLAFGTGTKNYPENYKRIRGDGRLSVATNG